MNLDKYFTQFWHIVLQALRKLTKASNLILAEIVLVASVVVNAVLCDIFSLPMAIAALLWLWPLIERVSDRVAKQEPDFMTLREMKAVMIVRFLAMMLVVLQVPILLFASSASWWVAVLYIVSGLLFAAPGYFIFDFESSETRS